MYASTPVSRCAPRGHRQRGFSIIELLFVIVIAGVLAAVAVPGMQGLARDQTRATLLNELNSAVRFARAEAIGKRRATVLCSLDGATCSAAADANFAAGWIVFLDADGDGEKDVADEPVLREYAPRGTPSETLHLRVTTSRAGAARRVVTFDRLGRLRIAPGAPDPQTHFVYCDEGGDDTARAIYVTFAGTPVLATDADSNGKDDYGDLDFNCP